MKAGQYDYALAILSIIGTIIWINLDRLDGGGDVEHAIPRRGIQKLVQINYSMTVRKTLCIAANRKPDIIIIIKTRLIGSSNSNLPKALKIEVDPDY